MKMKALSFFTYIILTIATLSMWFCIDVKKYGLEYLKNISKNGKPIKDPSIMPIYIQVNICFNIIIIMLSLTVLILIRDAKSKMQIYVELKD